MHYPKKFDLVHQTISPHERVGLRTKLLLSIHLYTHLLSLLFFLLFPSSFSSSLLSTFLPSLSSISFFAPPLASGLGTRLPLPFSPLVSLPDYHCMQHGLGVRLFYPLLSPLTGNTITNVSMIVPALVGLWSCYKFQLETRYLMGYLGLLCKPFSK